MSCTSQVLSMAITEADAIRRIDSYDNIRRTCLDPLHPGGKTEISVISYEITGFLTLMDLLITKAKAVTEGGIKIYFASYIQTGHKENDDNVPAGMLGNLTLVFAPTTIDDEGNICDTKECYILPPSVLPQVPAVLPPVNHTDMTKLKKVVSGWVRSYQENKLPALSKRLQRPDTKWLWYNVEDFRLMIAEIHCQINTQHVPFTHVNFSFATFEDNKWLENCKMPQSVITRFFVGGQMSLVISPIKLTAAVYEIVYLERLPAGKIRDDDDYDTGIPIPPASGGGEGLP